MPGESTNVTPTAPQGAAPKPAEAAKPAAAPTTTETPKPGTKSAEWTSAMKRANQQRQKEEALKTERAEFEKQKAEIEKQRKVIENAKRNPLELLKLGGLTYEQLTAAQLADGKPTPELELSAVKDDLTKLRQEQERFQQEQQEAGKRAKEEAAQAELTNWRKGVAAKIHGATDKYPLLALYSRGGIVAEHIESHFARTLADGAPETLDVDAAAQAKEAEFAAALEGDLEKLVKLPQGKAILDKVLGKLKPAEEPKPEMRRIGPRTIDSRQLAPRSTAVKEAKTPHDVWKSITSRTTT